MNDTVILIPTYNERQNIALLIPELFGRYPDVRVLVIDDASPDGTGEEVNLLMQKYPNLSLLSRAGKLGLGTAYKEAMEIVLKDETVKRVMTMDADGSHDVAYIGDMLKASKDRDLVVGSRYVRGGGIENWEKWRYMLSFFGNMYARTIMWLPIRDVTAGFMCIRASALKRVDLSKMHASGYAFLMELKYSLVHDVKGRAAEVPIVFKSRREGESKISRHIIREGLKTPWRLMLFGGPGVRS